MFRIEASSTSMNWTRLSRIRIATPRRDDSDEVSGAASSGAALGWRSVFMSRASVSWGSLLRGCSYGGVHRVVEAPRSEPQCFDQPRGGRAAARILDE